MRVKSRIVMVSGLAALCIALMIGGCATPARTDQMEIAEFEVTEPQITAAAERGIALDVTVYGDDVGGLASLYYPLPRADFEKALLASLASTNRFRVVPRGSDADFRLSVGLVQLIQPQWSGTVTLETAWSVTAAATGAEIARRPVRVEQPASFSKKREATELAASASIAEGIKWLGEVVEPRSH